MTASPEERERRRREAALALVGLLVASLLGGLFVLKSGAQESQETVAERMTLGDDPSEPTWAGAGTPRSKRLPREAPRLRPSHPELPSGAKEQGADSPESESTPSLELAAAHARLLVRVVDQAGVPVVHACVRALALTHTTVPRLASTASAEAIEVTTAGDGTAVLALPVQVPHELSASHGDVESIPRTVGLHAEAEVTIRLAPMGTLIVSVVDDQDGSPIGGATVRARPRPDKSEGDAKVSGDRVTEGITQSDGQVVLDVFGGENQSVTVRAPGYPLTFATARRGSDSLLVRVERGARLCVTVADAGFRPKIQVTQGSSFTGGIEPHRDVHGHWRFELLNLKQGQVTVLIDRGGDTPILVRSLEAPAGDPTDLIPELEVDTQSSGGSLVVECTLTSPWALWAEQHGVIVQWSYVGDSAPSSTRLNRLEPGPYKIVAGLFPHRSGTQTWTLGDVEVLSGRDTIFAVDTSHLPGNPGLQPR